LLVCLFRVTFKNYIKSWMTMGFFCFSLHSLCIISNYLASISKRLFISFRNARNRDFDEKLPPTAFKMDIQIYPTSISDFSKHRR
jgi:hypothetical protein